MNDIVTSIHGREIGLNAKGRLVVRNGIASANMYAPRSQKISYMHNGSACETVNLGVARTHMTVVPMPDDCYAVRFGFANITSSTYGIGGVAYSASDSVNDYIAPTGSHGWLYSTWNSAGVDYDDYVFAGASTIQAGTALANTTHPVTAATDIPKITWTDWNLLSVASPLSAPTTATRYLFARCLTNTGTLTRVAANNTGFTGLSDVNLGWDHANYYSATDRVTTITNGGAVDTYTFFYVVQFLCRRPGVSMMIGGTSTHQGYTSTTAGTNIAFYASALLRSAGHCIYPVNAAWGGSNSDKYWPVFNNLVSTVRPGIALICPWTSNDTPVSSSTTVDKMIARGIQMANEVRKVGGIPIFLTPNLRDTATMASVTYANWLYARTAILALEKQGNLVFDWANALLAPDTTPEAAGGILPLSYASSDVTHASTTAQQKMGKALAAYIRSFL